MPTTGRSFIQPGKIDYTLANQGEFIIQLLPDPGQGNRRKATFGWERGGEATWM